jgi:anti-anti-sigma factor
MPETTQLDILEQSPAFTQVALKGRLDTSGVDRVETRLTVALASGGHAIIDLSEVTFLASLGIRLLITVAKMLDRRGKRLVLVAPRALVDQSLKHSSIDEIIPVAANHAGARELLGV